MKKLALLLTFVMVLTLFVAPASFSASAAQPSASLSGPSELRAGDTVKISFTVNGDDILGFQCMYDFDPAQFSLSVDPKTSITGWTLEHQKETGRIIVTDESQKNPISGKKTLFTISFKADKNLSAGTVASILFKSIEITYKTGSTNFDVSEHLVDNLKYEKTVAQPKSNNANLKSLSVSGFEFTTAFSASKTSYSLKNEVPFSTGKLTVTATPDDPNATVSISGTNLDEGNNTTKITVTAENGTTKKTYTISSTRQKNPDYQSSTDATLSSLTPVAGTLSPLFDPAITDYIVFVPFEQTVFSATATATDPKATVSPIDEILLEEGANEIKVTVTAENGDTLEYSLCIYRLPLYEGTAPTIKDPNEAEPPADDPPADDNPPSEENPPSDDNPTDDDVQTIIKTEYITETVGVPFYLAAILSVLGIGIGFTLALVFVARRG